MNVVIVAVWFACGLIIVGSYLARRKRRRLAAVPVPGPMRIVRANGDVVPLDLVFAFTDTEGVHHWSVVTDTRGYEGDVIECDRIPSRCAIGWHYIVDGPWQAGE